MTIDMLRIKNIVLVWVCVIHCCSIAFSQDYLVRLNKSARGLILKGSSCEELGKDNCKRYFLAAIQKAIEADSCVACAITEYARHEINQGNIELGETYLNWSMRILTNPSWKDTLVWTLKSENFTLRAMASYIKGDMVLAMNNLLESAKITDKYGDPKVAALQKVNVANIHAAMGNFDEAIRYGLLAHKELVNHDDKRYATLAANLATYYAEKANEEKAWFWARKAIFHGEKHDFVNPIVSGYNVLAAIHSNQNQDSALYYSFKSMELAKSANIPRIFAGSLLIHGQSLSRIGNFKRAHDYLEEALNIYIDGNDAEEYAVYRFAAENALKAGFHEKAAHYFEQVLDYQDSVLSFENREITADLLSKYESEKKDKELAEKRLLIQTKTSENQLIIVVSLLGFIILTLLLLFLRIRYLKGVQKLMQEKENEMLNAYILGEEEERKRLSRELHDGIAAMISAAKMNLEAISYQPEKEKSQHLERIKSILEATNDEIRFIAHNLIPEKLDTEGLVGALGYHIASINSSGLIEIEFLPDNAAYKGLSKTTEQMFYRIIQELLNNIVKHSRATKAAVKLFTNSSRLLSIEVSDNGIGVDQGKIIENQGLKEIQKRLHVIGATFSIETNPNEGTHVRIEYGLTPHNA